MCADPLFIIIFISEMPGRQLSLIRSAVILNTEDIDVDFVSNFTDVDDKLIKAANELGEDVPAIAERFIQAYYEDMEALAARQQMLIRV